MAADQAERALGACSVSTWNRSNSGALADVSLRLLRLLCSPLQFDKKNRMNRGAE